MNPYQALSVALSLACLASCQTYRSEFDCPPGIGVPCASVSDIESMIIETPQGPDIFLANQGVSNQPFASQRCCESARRVWVVDTCSDGIEGHYLYVCHDVEE